MTRSLRSIPRYLARIPREHVLPGLVRTAPCAVIGEVSDDGYLLCSTVKGSRFHACRSR